MPEAIPFTLAQLQYFVAVAETGTMTDAAHRVSTTQPALSTAMSRLERQLGCQLFVRHHAKGVSVTAAGQELLVLARGVLRQAEELAVSSRQLQTGLSGTLRVGCFPTLMPAFLPPVLHALRAEHPELTVAVHEADTADLMTALREGGVEVAVAYGLGIGEQVEFRPVTRQRPYVLVPEDDPVARQKKVRLGKLAARPLVLLDLPEPRSFVEQALHLVIDKVPDVLRTTSQDGVRALVAAGLGFSIMNQRSADTTGVCAVEIEDRLDPVAIGLATPSGVTQTRRARVFTERFAALHG
ncbi:LysR family transcriptional regulator [Sciscionella sediminilitoris]|uniref:LysR family transcriptional regulator n=1 Tax=Sciscionella sediminilitoris TaxID=1445613 RepID=UPI0004DF7C1F|nr:LysR substrate-binding domain-containing protein [Sciscionella sp. SE31]